MYLINIYKRLVKLLTLFRLMKANDARPKPTKQTKLEETSSTLNNFDRANVTDDHKMLTLTVQTNNSKLVLKNNL